MTDPAAVTIATLELMASRPGIALVALLARRLVDVAVGAAVAAQGLLLGRGDRARSRAEQGAAGRADHRALGVAADRLAGERAGAGADQRTRARPLVRLSGIAAGHGNEHAER